MAIFILGSDFMKKLKWHTEKRIINQLIPYENNPRIMTEKQKADLQKSLEEFDLVEIPAIDTDNKIIAGHQRLKIMQLLGRGNEEIDVRVPNRKLTEEEFKKYNLRSNKNTGEWDWDMLANYDEELLLDIGFDEYELNEKFDIASDDEKDDLDVVKAIETIKEPMTKTGDVWQLGNHKLLCGDSTSDQDIKRLIGNNDIKLVFTSPPYNMAGKMYSNYDDNLKSQEYIDFNINVIKNIRPFLKGFLFWNISYNKNSRWEWIEIFYRITKETGINFLEKIVWDKGHGIPITSKKQLTRQYEDIFLGGTEAEIENELTEAYLGTTLKKYAFNKRTGKGITNYWRITTNKIQTVENSACFPVALPVKAILLMTMYKENVLDLFLGLGSTLIACERTKRKCFGMEIDPVYCDVIIKRWENYTGNKAVKINE